MGLKRAATANRFTGRSGAGIVGPYEAMSPPLCQMATYKQPNSVAIRHLFYNHCSLS